MEQVGCMWRCDIVFSGADQGFLNGGSVCTCMCANALYSQKEKVLQIQKRGSVFARIFPSSSKVGFEPPDILILLHCIRKKKKKPPDNSPGCAPGFPTRFYFT